MEPKNKKVLVAPLNWGLGHATRCIPVIRELIRQGAEIYLASDGAALSLLKQEFPDLPSFELPAYGIQYATGKFLPLKMLMQIPRILKAISKEHEVIQQLVKKYQLDCIISDNRYGLYHNKVKTVFITHQLNIQSLKGFEWMGKWINKMNHWYILKFNTCWVPDVADENNLSGDLSHGNTVSFPVKYVGPLTRFSASNSTQQNELVYNLAIILSGPEPQRTRFEDIITKQLNTVQGKVLIVRGLPDSHHQIKSTGNVFIVNHLNGFEMESAIRSSQLVLCRAGYSGIMDLAILGKNAILVPTPGQTEQEYLAHYFYRKGIFFSVNQDQFDLKEAVQKSQGFSGIQSTFILNLIPEIQLLLNSIEDHAL